MLCLTETSPLDSTYWYEVALVKEKRRGVLCMFRKRWSGVKKEGSGGACVFVVAVMGRMLSFSQLANFLCSFQTTTSTQVGKVDLASLETSHQALED
jgi:hypothetical protein